MENIISGIWSPYWYEFWDNPVQLRIFYMKFGQEVFKFDKDYNFNYRIYKVIKNIMKVGRIHPRFKITRQVYDEVIKVLDIATIENEQVEYIQEELINFNLGYIEIDPEIDRDPSQTFNKRSHSNTEKKEINNRVFSDLIPQMICKYPSGIEIPSVGKQIGGSKYIVEPQKYGFAFRIFDIKDLVPDKKGRIILDTTNSTKITHHPRGLSKVRELFN